MSIRFQADADLDQTIVTALIRREPSIDFQTASAVGLVDFNDVEVLSIAAREGRILASHDSRTMPHHFATLLQSQTSAGLLIAPQRLTLAVVVEDLLLIWGASSPEEWVNRICYLPLDPYDPPYHSRCLGVIACRA